MHEVLNRCSYIRVDSTRFETAHHNRGTASHSLNREH